MIVGAGVVGCYLGKLVGDCEIWEKNPETLEKPCGGLVSKNIRDLDIDLSECVVNEVKGARFFSDNKSFEISKNKTQAYVLDRLALQKSLAQDAIDNGCSILYDKKWNGQQDEYIIGADGAVSYVAKSCGVKREYLHAYQIECTLMNKTDPDFVELHLGDFAPGFFGWLIPVDEKKVRIGLGCASGNLKEHFSVFKKKFHTGRTEKEGAALIPIFDSQRTVFENIALVGDAAAQAKSTTGGGIIFGLKCAEELKEAIDRDDLGRYELSWRSKYESDLRNHLRLRNFLDKQNYDELFNLIKEKKLDELITEHGDMDHPGRLVKEVMKRPDLWSFLGRVFLRF